MICPKCHVENTTRHTYCKACGAELDHSLQNVQASVDKEIKRERVAANALRVRWLLGFTVLLFAAGFIFRRNFRDLPSNSVVAFAAPPAVELDHRIAPKSAPFDVKLPKLEAVNTRPSRIDHKAIFDALTEEARLRRSVSLKRKQMKVRLVGLLVGDRVLYAQEPGTLALLPISIAHVRELRPAGKDTWEVRVDGRNKPLRISPPFPGAIQLRLLVYEEGKEPTVQPVPLTNIEEIVPLSSDPT
ncbi:hypothetical protein HQ560_02205 [bacterium]|nr:hypothetical protein [bacterium]